MSWGVNSRDWADTKKVKGELSRVVQIIACYEPVRVLASRGPMLREARREFGSCTNITVMEGPVDDIWMRDIAPTFALRDGDEGQEIVAIDWNFNGWGGTGVRHKRPGDQLAKTAAGIFSVPGISVPFVAEGGAFITDGRGTVITTQSCLLNPNRNPLRSGHDRQRMIEGELGKLGANKVIWLEGDPSERITSGHVDGYVMVAPDSVVLVETVDDEDNEPSQWREHDISLLENAHNALGHKVEIRRVLAPRKRYWKGDPETFAPCYLNAYVANGAMIGAKFGDTERDEAAQQAFEAAFPRCKVILLPIDHIADGGGCVHCLTQPMPV
jgi:agmatine deiminase